MEEIVENQGNLFIARQPILDKVQNIFAYELFSRSSGESQAAPNGMSVSDDSEMMFNILSTFGIEQLLDGKKAFLNCILEGNNLDYFELIKPKNIVIEVMPPEELHNKDSIEEIKNKMITLKNKGYELAAGEFALLDGYENIFALLDYLKVDGHNKPEKVAFAVKKALANKKKIVAEKVETAEQFNYLKRFGIEFFQGYFFAKPTNVSAKITSPAVSTIIRLINLVLQEADIKELEKVLKTDPTLSFKLFRYMNSYGVGGGAKVETLNQALMMLGYKPLFKWLSILFTTNKKGEGSDAITKMALIRAKFMELLANDCLSKKDADQCFVVGMFSMLDVLLNVPIDVALSSIDLNDSIKDPILNKSGDYWPLLSLTVSIEVNDWIDVFAIAYQMKLSSTLINERYLQAIEWSNKLSLGS